MSSENNTSNGDEIEVIKLPLRYVDAEGLQTRYTNTMIVQHTPDEFVLQFFEVIPPILFGPPEEVERLRASLEYVEAKCVARLIISPERIPSIIQALQSNYERFLNKDDKGGIEDE
jgi:hypothetical protein